MAKLSTYICDECQCIKKDANGWWLISPGTDGVTVWPWLQIQNAVDGWRHVCGIECAQKYLGRWMAERGEQS